MGDAIRTFWIKRNGEIVDLQKERETDEFLKHHWHQNHKIASLYKFGATYQLDIKEGGHAHDNFNSVEIDFKSAKDLNDFLKKMRVKP